MKTLLTIIALGFFFNAKSQTIAQSGTVEQNLLIVGKSDFRKPSIRIKMYPVRDTIVIDSARAIKDLFYMIENERQEKNKLWDIINAQQKQLKGIKSMLLKLQRNFKR